MRSRRWSRVSVLWQWNYMRDIYYAQTPPPLARKKVCMMMVEHFLRCAEHLHNKSIQWMMSYMHSSTCPESIYTADSEQLRNHSMAIRLIPVWEREHKTGSKKIKRGRSQRLMKKQHMHNSCLHLLTSVNVLINVQLRLWKIYTTTTKWILNEWHHIPPCKCHKATVGLVYSHYIQQIFASPSQTQLLEGLRLLGD